MLSSRTTSTGVDDHDNPFSAAACGSPDRRFLVELLEHHEEDAIHVLKTVWFRHVQLQAHLRQANQTRQLLSSTASRPSASRHTTDSLCGWRLMRGGVTVEVFIDIVREFFGSPVSEEEEEWWVAPARRIFEGVDAHNEGMILFEDLVDHLIRAGNRVFGKGLHEADSQDRSPCSAAATSRSKGSSRSSQHKEEEEEEGEEEEGEGEGENHPLETETEGEEVQKRAEIRLDEDEESEDGKYELDRELVIGLVRQIRFVDESKSSIVCCLKTTKELVVCNQIRTHGMEESNSSCSTESPTLRWYDRRIDRPLLFVDGIPSPYSQLVLCDAGMNVRFYSLERLPFGQSRHPAAENEAADALAELRRRQRRSMLAKIAAKCGGTHRRHHHNRDQLFSSESSLVEMKHPALIHECSFFRTGSVVSMTFDERSNLLFSGSRSGVVLVWKPEEDQDAKLYRFKTDEADSNVSFAFHSQNIMDMAIHRATTLLRRQQPADTLRRGSSDKRPIYQTNPLLASLILQPYQAARLPRHLTDLPSPRAVQPDPNK